MLTWKEIVQEYIIRHSNKIQNVTRPLREHFGIEYFTYHHIDRHGKYTVLVDRPDWAEHYVSKKFYLEDPYLRHPDVYKTGACFIDSHGSDEYRNAVLKDGKKFFDLDSGIILIEKTENGCEFFGYSGNRRNSNLHKLYLNHLPILQAFSRYFKEELSSLLNQMDEEANLLQNLKGKDFHLKTPIIPKMESDLHLDFLKAIGMEKFAEKGALLSPREKECMKLLLLGKSAKETALLLGLSPRTVEFYFENIRKK